MGSPALAHNMSYAAIRAMFYLVIGARRIQILNEMEVAHTGYGAWEVELKHQISKLDKDVHEFNQRGALLSLEKTDAEEIISALQVKVESLT